MTELISSLPLILLTSFFPWLVKVLVLDEKGETSEKSCQNLDALESIIIELAGSTNTVREQRGTESGGEEPKKQNSKPGQNLSETGTSDLSQKDSQESASLDKFRRRVQMVKAALLLENIKEFTGVRKAAFLMYVYFCSLSSALLYFILSPIDVPQIIDKFSESFGHVDLVVGMLVIFIIISPMLFLLVMMNGVSVNYVQQIIDDVSARDKEVNNKEVNNEEVNNKKVNNLRKFHRFLRRHYLWSSVGLLVVLIGVSAGLHWCYFVNGNNGYFFLLVWASIVATINILLIFNMFPNSHHYFLSEDEG